MNRQSSATKSGTICASHPHRCQSISILAHLHFLSCSRPGSLHQLCRCTSILACSNPCYPNSTLLSPSSATQSRPGKFVLCSRKARKLVRGGVSCEGVAGGLGRLKKAQGLIRILLRKGSCLSTCIAMFFKALQESDIRGYFKASS